VSDIQYGEFISLEEVDGLNSYSIKIADQRIDRLFHYTSLLSKGVEEVVVLLGGDMISGGLHDELAKTDELPELPASKRVAARIAANLVRLSVEVKAPIRVISVPGNHGRLTFKPESKGHVLNNFDTLVTWFIEAALADQKSISFHYGPSVDALFDVYGFPILLTHGDRMGSKGGQGFIGAMATITRGHQKLYMDYASRGVPVYKIFTGHFHTAGETPWGHANGTLAGFGEYARDFRMAHQPATQNLVIFHREHGEICRHRILCGIPEEGTSQNPSKRFGG
jgi:hypothetical protein